MAGSWCADEIWKIALSEVEATKLEARHDRNRTLIRDERHLAKLENDIQLIKEARHIVEMYDFPDPPLGPEGELDTTQVSQKVLKLHDILYSMFGEGGDQKCIIFVTERYTAHALARLLKHTGPPEMRLGVLIGRKTGKVGEENVSFRQQTVIVNRFRNGRLNCLLATSVAEEGLDIPDCNQIIRLVYTS